MTALPDRPRIDCQVNAASWQDLPDLEKLAADAVGAALSVVPAGRLPEGSVPEVSILFADDGLAQELNQAHRGKDRPTNVLAFPQPAPPVPEDWPLGDLVLAGETVAREANAGKVSLSAHTTHLIVHGFLHLLGYDHQTDDDAAEMEALEIDAMTRLGLRNPYEPVEA